MLGKLLKYEIKAFGRVMLPLYGVMLAVSVFYAAMLRFTMNEALHSILDTFALLGGVLFVIAIAAVMVAIVVMVIQRFYRNLLGTEGYLMFTLPVSTLEHILSKMLSAMLWILLGMLTGLLSGALMVAISGNLPGFLNQFDQLTRMLKDGEIVRNIILFTLMMVFDIMGSLSKVYASIAIGHQWGSHRILGAILAFFGLNLVEMALLLLPPVRAFLQNDSIRSTVPGFTGLSIATSALQLLLFGAIAWRLLDRSLNLE